ncbi:MAG: hypothetical protein Q8K63_11955, partial [Acidimicrobiales bacterium]|nr:hypothetical protein [Acidimicrobiales bacterium]
MPNTGVVQEFVDHHGPARLLTGGYSSGKTDALVARWLRLATEHGPGRVLFVARRASAAVEVRRRMVAAAHDAGLVAGPLAVTTWTGLALDLVRRHEPSLTDAALLTGPAQRQLIGEVFAADNAPWSASAEVVNRRAFPSELARGTRALLSSPMTSEEIISVADAVGLGDRWGELAAFVQRYRSVLRERNLVDVNEVVGLAIAAVAADDARAALGQRFVEILVDDAEAMSPSAVVLLNAIATAGVPVTITSNPAGMRGSIVHEPVDHAAVFAAQHDAASFTLESPER